MISSYTTSVRAGWWLYVDLEQYPHVRRALDNKLRVQVILEGNEDSERERESYRKAKEMLVDVEQRLEILVEEKCEDTCCPWVSYCMDKCGCLGIIPAGLMTSVLPVSISWGAYEYCKHQQEMEEEQARCAAARAELERIKTKYVADVCMLELVRPGLYCCLSGSKSVSFTQMILSNFTDCPFTLRCDRLGASTPLTFALREGKVGVAVWGENYDRERDLSSSLIQKLDSKTPIAWSL